MTSRNIAIRIYESSNCGVVISALEVIPSSFGVKVVPTVAQGVDVSNMVEASNIVPIAVFDRENTTPGVIFIICNRLTAGIDQTNNIALEVQKIIVNNCCASNRRIRAVKEAKRVLKPGGYLFSSFILMFGGVIYGLRELQETILWPKEQVLFDVAAKDESLAFEAFTYSWMTTVQDAEKLLAAVPGLRTETVFGQEGILAPYRNILSQSTAKVRAAWYDYALRFCEKREYLTHTENLMIM